MQLSLGERIRLVRGQKKLTLQQLASVILFDKSYISRLESGKSLNPSHKFIEKFCASFGVNKDWLLTGKGTVFVAYATSPEYPMGSSPDPDLKAFYEEVNHILEPERVLRVVMEAVPRGQFERIGKALAALPDMSDAIKLFWFQAFLRAGLIQGEDKQPLFDDENHYLDQQELKKSKRQKPE